MTIATTLVAWTCSGVRICYYPNPCPIHHRAISPQCLQIFGIDREGMIDDIISHGIWRHWCKKYLLTWSSQICNVSHYCAHCNGIIYHTELYDEMFNVNSKIAQTTQNIQTFIVAKLNLQLNGKLRHNTREISCSNLKTRRCGPKSVVSQIIWKSWQHWHNHHPTTHHPWLTMFNTRQPPNMIIYLVFYINMQSIN